MICTECNGRGETIYYEEIDRDENTVTAARRKCICRTCNGSGEKPKTNADKIRAMTDEELADWLARTQIANVAEVLSIAKIPYEIADDMHDAVKKECLEWLKQPAEKE
jgi:hypothetical protein